jgi:hypothetical protein
MDKRKRKHCVTAILFHPSLQFVYLINYTPDTCHHHITQHRALDKYTSDHQLNIPHNTNRQSPESSEHQILWLHVIPSLVIIDNLTTTFNQDFNNRRGYNVSPTPKCSDPCSFEVCVRPEDGYHVSRNMSPMWCVLVNIRRVVFASIYLLNFEITQRYRQYKYKKTNVKPDKISIT